MSRLRPSLSVRWLALAIALAGCQQLTQLSKFEIGSTTPGTGGSSGGGGSAPSNAASAVGLPCASDADCAGGTCLAPTAQVWSGAGPARGMCTIDCTAWEAAGENGTSPCVGNPFSPVDNVCVPFEATRSLCMRSCTFGEPPVQGSSLHADKCFGRDDVACAPVVDGSGIEQYAFCRPQCASDAQCPAAAPKCDPLLGGCVAAIGATGKNGDPCDASENAARSCEGLCVHLYDSSDPSVPVEKRSLGMCIDPCEVGLSSACGGTGMCVFDVFAPYREETGGTYVVVPVGAQDRGGCAKAVSPGDDASCYWEEGWFTYTFGNGVTACFYAPPCREDADCVLLCADTSECPVGDTCEDGKCILYGGSFDTGSRACRVVPPLATTLCLDHQPNVP